jgi:uncharacterized protein
MILHTSLSKAELDDLNATLARVTAGKGLDIFGLDGFFSALAIGPSWVLPSVFLRWVWDQLHGVAEPRFDSRSKAKAVTFLLLRHYNAAGVRFSDNNAAEFEPLFRPGDEAAESAWCRGFLLATRFEEATWRRLMKDEPSWFDPLIAAARREEAKTRLTEIDLAELREQLVPSLLAIRKHFLPLRRPAHELHPSLSANPSSLEPRPVFGSQNRLDSTELDELFDRIEAATDGRGMNLVFLEGLCASLAIGPRPVAPSTWLSWVWDSSDGEEEPQFADAADAERALELVMRFHDSLVDTLQSDEIDFFEPIFPPLDRDGLTAWTAAFFLGFQFNKQEWQRLSRAEPRWFAPFMLPRQLLEGQELLDEDMALFQESLPLSLRLIRDHWRGRDPAWRGPVALRLPGSDAAQPRRTGPKIGRNELCLCGSGKKYKKCCGVN